jgi:peptidoglycan/xylan/chitin deacetylase (PgdA/CDA1 family)
MSSSLPASSHRSSRREQISSALGKIGITRALEALARTPSLIVLNYHRVGDPELDDYDPALLEVTPDAFDEQMAFLKKRYRVCDVGEALDLIARPNTIREPSFLITFDDGYRDNHSVALPILRSHGIQAVFFLATGFVGTSRIPWWDQIAFMCRRTERRTISIEYPEKRTFALDGPSRYRVIRDVIRMNKSAATMDSGRFMAQLESECAVACPKERAERLFMSWDEARDLVSAGMGVGSHTHNHEILAKQTAAAQFEECKVSRDVLEAELGLEVSMLSYPVGGRGTFDDVTIGCVRRAGYRFAFTYGGGVNIPSELQPLTIARMAVEPCSLNHYRTRIAVAAFARREYW